MATTKKASGTADRLIKAYPTKYYHKLTLAYADFTGESISGIACEALREKFEKIPLQERDRIMKLYEPVKRQSKNSY